jgi:putative membrane protein
MLMIKAFHIIATVAWFAGLFYLPRLFVYHADAKDEIGIERFKIMEYRLYYAIMWPAAVVTNVLGFLLIILMPHEGPIEGWRYLKLALVGVLWVYHLSCGHYLKGFAHNRNQRSSVFYRVYNEVPTLLLITIVILVVVKPF